MMRSIPRKTTPKVRGGKSQRKNRTDLSPGYKNHLQHEPIIDRLRPGPGYRHVLKKRDIERFIELLPDWEELSKGLDAVLLAEGEPDCFGWHHPGVVAICAWDRELGGTWYSEFVVEHQDLLDRLGVSSERCSPGTHFLDWTEESVKGFQLLHLFLHELGHHHDRITTRSQRHASRGESYAEQYAQRYAEEIWEKYGDAFGV